MDHVENDQEKCYSLDDRVWDLGQEFMVPTFLDVIWIPARSYHDREVLMHVDRCPEEAEVIIGLCSKKSW